MLHLWVYCSHVPSVGWWFFSKQPKPVITLRKIHQSSGLEECTEFQLHVFHWFGPTLTKMMKLVGPRVCRRCLRLQVSPATVCRISNLFSGQLRSRILRCPLICVLFSVLCVDCEECLCIFVGFLPSARHAVVCLLFSLEQSRVVD